MSEERVKEQDTDVSCLVLVTIFESGLFIAKNYVIVKKYKEIQ